MSGLRLRSPTSERGAAAGRAAPQERANARQQLAPLEGLDQVVVGAAVEPADPVVGLRARGEHEDRHVALGAQLAADLGSVQPGEAEIEHDEVGDEGMRLVKRLDAVARGAHLVALVAKRPAENVRDLRIVLDDEHPTAALVAIRDHDAMLDARPRRAGHI